MSDLPEADPESFRQFGSPHETAGSDAASVEERNSALDIINTYFDIEKRFRRSWLGYIREELRAMLRFAQYPRGCLMDATNLSIAMYTLTMNRDSLYQLRKQYALYVAEEQAFHQLYTIDVAEMEAQRTLALEIEVEINRLLSYLLNATYSLVTAF